MKNVDRTPDAAAIVFRDRSLTYRELDERANAIAHALQFPPIGVVVRALDNPKLNRLLEDVRTSTGNSVIHRRGGLRRILRALAENKGVAVLIDQHINTADAVMVDFFDRPASTTGAASDAPKIVVIMTNYRGKSGHS